jgi:hypothetical protein
MSKTIVNMGYFELKLNVTFSALNPNLIVNNKSSKYE